MKKNMFILTFVSLLFSCEYEKPVVKEASIVKTSLDKKEVVQTPRSVAPKVPKEMVFAGEKIVFDDLDLKERMDNELLVNTYWHSSTIMTMKLANRFLPEMKAILKEEGLPEDLVYVAIIESGLKNVVSPAGAKGFWQFMEAAGKEFGLTITSQIDERYHLEKSTRAACHYLKKAYAKFGTWSLAAAAYNRGMGGIQRDLDQQGVSDFFDLSLNNETARYVFRLFAVKLVLENPTEYGFYLEDEDLYPPYRTKDIKVTESIESIYEWAIEQGVSTKIVRKLNPWIIGKSIDLKNGEEIIVKLPQNQEQLRLIGG